VKPFISHIEILENKNGPPLELRAILVKEDKGVRRSDSELIVKTDS
jgi:hypothetical protein